MQEENQFDVEFVIYCCTGMLVLSDYSSTPRSGGTVITGETLPFPLPPLPLLISRPFPSLPLEVGPLNPVRGLGSAVSSPSGVWGETPAEVEFGAF